MSAFLLATRDALAAALYRLEWDADLYATPRNHVTEKYERRAERLLASGVVRDPSTLADDEAPTPEQVERGRVEALPGHTYPDGRPKMHRHAMSYDVHRDDECDRGVLPGGTWATSRRRVYVFDDDVLGEHERHITLRALAAALTEDPTT